jgi:hypothetical protein
MAFNLQYVQQFGVCTNQIILKLIIVLNQISKVDFGPGCLTFQCCRTRFIGWPFCQRQNRLNIALSIPSAETVFASVFGRDTFTLIWT